MRVEVCSATGHARSNSSVRAGKEHDAGANERTGTSKLVFHESSGGPRGALALSLTIPILCKKSLKSIDSFLWMLEIQFFPFRSPSEYFANRTNQRVDHYGQ